MTPEEYKQLKAFARQDGALLSVLWIVAMACYIKGLSSPILGMVAMLLIVVSPFFAATRLRKFRDEAREGIISFMRAYGYTVLTYFYAGLLMAIAVYAYFQFIDNGFLMGKLTEMLNTEEGQQMMKIYGMADEISQSMEELAKMRPIDYALNMLTIIISTGFILGLPTAALMKRETAKVENQ
jgi:hypothetical protein